MSYKNKDDVISILTEKINDLNAFCITNKVPAVFMFAIESNGKTKTKTVVLTPTKLGIKLSDDHITPMVALVGTDKFKVIPIKQEEIFDETLYYPAETD
ncbi:MAG: hypothetical protein QM644_08025 [Mobilitalea sp.]